MNAPLPIHTLEDRGVLRFITAGSVDDGKSTLIGRLLYDTRSILADQITALQRAGERRAVVANGSSELDLSLLTDGLEAEREQGITIDVAYRYFATARRKFIIADTPGHEQYTRNMVTGASTADAAVILIDATRVSNGEYSGQLLPQTRRHTALVRLLGIRHVVIAVNKLDQLAYSQSAFKAIVDAYRALADRLGIADVTAIPVSALLGDNVVDISARTPWYRGPSLLEWLEQVPSALDDSQRAQDPLRFAVQLVLRGFEGGGSEGGGADVGRSSRGYAGRIGSGTLEAGQIVRVLPSGIEARVTAVGTYDGELERAQPGQSVVVRLDRELDISRGDWLVDPTATPLLTRTFSADLAWLDAAPMASQRKLWLRHGTRWVAARVRDIESVLDLSALEWRAEAGGSGGNGGTLAANAIARVKIETQQPLALDNYEAIRASGAFILADATTHHTVAAGMIRTDSEVRS